MLRSAVNHQLHFFLFGKEISFVFNQDYRWGSVPTTAFALLCVFCLFAFDRRKKLSGKENRTEREKEEREKKNLQHCNTISEASSPSRWGLSS